MLAERWISLKRGQDTPNKLGLAVASALLNNLSVGQRSLARRKHRSQAQASDLTGVAWRRLNQRFVAAPFKTSRPVAALFKTRAALQRCLKPAPRCGAGDLRFFLVKLLGHNRAAGAVQAQLVHHQQFVFARHALSNGVDANRVGKGCQGF